MGRQLDEEAAQREAAANPPAIGHTTNAAAPNKPRYIARRTKIVNDVSEIVQSNSFCMTSKVQH